MNRQRMWILGCAVGCFLTGMSTGLALPEVVQAYRGPAAGQDPNERYVRRFVADFDLTSAQRRDLRIVMRQFQEDELAVFYSADRDKLPESVRGELVAARRRQIARIRALLTDEQRARYDQRDPSRGLGEER